MIPKPLYKVFNKRIYAEKFINDGELRFSTLGCFKTIEDRARVDSSEGFGEALRDGQAFDLDTARNSVRFIPGVERLHVEGGNEESFIFCMSAPNSGRLQAVPRKFGKYVVRIRNPEQLLRDVEEAMRRDVDLEQNRPQLEHAPVRYDKGEYINSLTKQDEDELGWTQKPAIFKEEYEYRLRFLVIPALLGYPKCYPINVGKKLAYCELIVRMDEAS